MLEDDFITKLREKGFKATPQRLTIFKVVITRQDHPTAEQIYKEVVRNHPTVSIATIYHSLHLLKELGFVQELGGPGSSRFDPNIKPHVNIICSTCSEVYDYFGETVEEFWSQIISELNIKPVGQRLDLYTICKECSLNNK